VKILHKHKRSAALGVGLRFGFCLAACLSWSRAASAEVELVNKDGWTFTFDGRINAFLSGGFGDDLPNPTPNPDPNAPTHYVMGGLGDPLATNAGVGHANVGWPGNYGQQDAENHYKAIRVRSGMYGNILGFGVARKVGEDTTIRGYISIWSTVESLGYDKWAPITPEAREGYFNVTGPWGTATIGRTLGWLGRMSWDIDTAYGHGYGVGLPCTDSIGPACGHIGTGAIFPGYGANISYATPSIGGLRLHAGLFDPVVFSTSASDWSHASFVRPEGALTFDRPMGVTGRIKLGVEGLYQPISRIAMDDTTGNTSRVTTAIWGVSGGLRIEAGPLRLGVSGFRGKGLGLFYALQRGSANEDTNSADPQLRTFTGGYGQLALVFGKAQLSGGFGMSYVNQTTFDKSNAGASVIRYQRGISGGFYYYATDFIVFGVDFFNFAAGWWGAPTVSVDPNTMVTTVTGKLAGETQVLNFVNAGLTYHW
jgi:hypothetical protein